MLEIENVDETNYSTNLIREVFGYTSRFKSQIFVLKIEDDLLSDPLFPLLIQDMSLVNRMGVKVIVVPGVRHSIQEWLKKENIETRFEKDTRITSQEALPIIKFASTHIMNRFFSTFSEYGVESAMGNWVQAQEMGVIRGVDYQYTGKVNSIKKETILSLLNNGVIPIVSNIGWGAKGLSYNISSNELAVFISQSLQASKLFFIGLKNGISQINQQKSLDLAVRDNGIYSFIELFQAKKILDEHLTDLPKIEKDLLQYSVQACEEGVDRVHILNGAINGGFLREIFSSRGRGTMIQKDPNTNIRLAKKEDILNILNLMHPFVKEEILLHRTAEDILGQLHNFFVYAVDDTIYACGSLRFFPASKQVEIQSIIVNPIYKRQGVGFLLVSFLIEKAKKEKMKSIFALTTQSSDFFISLGFSLNKLSYLPEDKEYNKQRNSKIFTKEL